VLLHAVSQRALHDERYSLEGQKNRVEMNTHIESLARLADEYANEVERLEADNRRLSAIAGAAINLVNQKGRYNTEAAYLRLYDVIRNQE
jgi:hypothetical protein